MERGMTADQVLSALWRRKLLVGVVAGAVLALGTAVVMGLPSVYEATVVVRMETQRPADEMVQRTVNEQVVERMATIRQELLARPVLQRVIEEQKLYPDIVEDDGMDAAVAKMRKALDVKVEGDSAFSLTYKANDPAVAQKVANRLPEIFTEEAVKVRHSQAKRATELFSGEIDVLKKSAAEWEQKIAQFKVDHLGELPEQMEMNMRGLERISAQLQTKSEELRAAEGRRSDLARSQLAADSEAGRLKAAELAVTRDLVGAKAQWTGDHPEVQRLGKELTALQTRRKDAESQMFAERQERARAAQLVETIQTDIEDLKKQAEAYQARLDHTPQWAHALAVMQRDYDVAREKYQSVVSRRVEAEIAQELELKGANSLFQVISPASQPTAPASPDRLGGIMVAALLALGLGVLVGVVAELRDDSVREPSELQQRLPVPVLAVVPELAGKTERRVLTPGVRNEVERTALN